MTGEKHLRLLLCCLAWGTLFCLVIAWVAILFSSLPFCSRPGSGICVAVRGLGLWGLLSFFFFFFPLILRLFCGTRGEGKKEVWALLQLKGHGSVKGLVQRC